MPVDDPRPLELAEPLRERARRHGADRLTELVEAGRSRMGRDEHLEQPAPSAEGRSLAASALRSPSYALRVALSILRGHWYK
jgi:hypothetical protein